MAEKTKHPLTRPKQKGYSLAEIKAKYLPNRTDIPLDQIDLAIMDGLFDVLKKDRTSILPTPTSRSSKVGK